MKALGGDEEPVNLDALSGQITVYQEIADALSAPGCDVEKVRKRCEDQQKYLMMVFRDGLSNQLYDSVAKSQCGPKSGPKR